MQTQCVPLCWPFLTFPPQFLNSFMLSVGSFSIWFINLCTQNKLLSPKKTTFQTLKMNECHLFPLQHQSGWVCLQLFVGNNGVLCEFLVNLSALHAAGLMGLCSHWAERSCSFSLVLRRNRGQIVFYLHKINLVDQRSTCATTSLSENI